MELSDTSLKSSIIQEHDLAMRPISSIHCEDATQPSSLPPRLPQEASQETVKDITKSPSSKIAELLKGKEREWATVIRKEGPLQLLDMPLDLLREILREVSRLSTLCR